MSRIPRPLRCGELKGGRNQRLAHGDHVRPWLAAFFDVPVLRKDGKHTDLAKTDVILFQKEDGASRHYCSRIQLLHIVQKTDDIHQMSEAEFLETYHSTTAVPMDQSVLYKQGYLSAWEASAGHNVRYSLNDQQRVELFFDDLELTQQTEETAVDSELWPISMLSYSDSDVYDLPPSYDAGGYAVTGSPPSYEQATANDVFPGGPPTATSRHHMVHAEFAGGK